MSADHEKSSSHLILLPKQASGENLSHELTMIQVFHPRQDSTILFVEGAKFFEVQKTQIAKYASWFIGQRVIPNKDILMTTPFDPRFILLPYFEKAGSRYSPLDQIVHSSTLSTPANVKIPPLEHWKQWRLEEIFDVNDKLGDDMIVFRFNKDKTMTWLQSKVEKVAKVLAMQRKRAQQQAQPLFAASFRSGSSFQQQQQLQQQQNPSNEEIIVDDVDRRTAIELISDNLSDSLIAELVKLYGFTTEEIMVTKANTSGVKRKADWEVALEQEKEEMARNALLKGPAANKNTNIDSTSTSVATTTATSATDYSIYLKGEHPTSASQPAAKVTKTMALNATAAKGTKSISSFFGAKK